MNSPILQTLDIPITRLATMRILPLKSDEKVEYGFVEMANNKVVAHFGYTVREQTKYSFDFE